MADASDKKTANAESLLKRLLERFGESVDKKLNATDPNEKRGLSSAEIANIETLLEREIDSSIVKDPNRGGNLAPNRFRVSLTHESSGGLGRAYLSALEEELTASALEFINNRRYIVPDDIRVEIATDVLAKVSSVKALHSESGKDLGTPKTGPGGRRCVLELRNGPIIYRVDLVAADSPANLGRLAPCRICIDDPSISRLHASVALNPAGEVLVSDLGSANGTSVNGKIVNTGEARRIGTGDVLTVGDVNLTVASISLAD